jgi:hypothetical protein
MDRAEWTYEMDIETTRTHTIDDQRFGIGSRVAVRTTIVLDDRVDDVSEKYIGHD